MKLFELIYHNEINPDEIETIYLIRSADFNSALAFASRNVSRKAHASHAPDFEPHRIIELGIDSGLDSEERFLREYEAFGSNYGWLFWMRDTDPDGSVIWREYRPQDYMGKDSFIEGTIVLRRPPSSKPE